VVSSTRVKGRKKEKGWKEKGRRKEKEREKGR